MEAMRKNARSFFIFVKQNIVCRCIIESENWQNPSFFCCLHFRFVPKISWPLTVLHRSHKPTFRSLQRLPAFKNVEAPSTLDQPQAKGSFPSKFKCILKRPGSVHFRPSAPLPRQCHINTTPMPRQCHANTMPIPRQYHANANSAISPSVSFKMPIMLFLLLFPSKCQ